MPVNVNFQSTKFTAKSRNFTENNPDPFCTFEVVEAGSSVTVFIHSVEDARLLVEAAIAAHGHAVSIELARRAAEERVLDEWLDEAEGLAKLKALLTEPSGI